MKVKYNEPDYNDQRDQISQMKDEVNLVDLIDSYVGDCVPKGNEYVCRCPFHDDSNPSMSINEDVYNCFTCAEGGDHITFIRKIENCDMKIAVEKLKGFFEGTLDPSYSRPYKGKYQQMLNYFETSIVRRVGRKVPPSFWDEYDDSLNKIDLELWRLTKEYYTNAKPDLQPHRQQFINYYITEEQDNYLLELLGKWYNKINETIKALEL